MEVRRRSGWVLDQDEQGVTGPNGVKGQTASDALSPAKCVEKYSQSVGQGQFDTGDGLGWCLQRPRLNIGGKHCVLRE